MLKNLDECYYYISTFEHTATELSLTVHICYKHNVAAFCCETGWSFTDSVPNYRTYYSIYIYEIYKILTIALFARPYNC
jgi:hypothetical protein